ncbi:uncharacterized protein EV154DRAFT_148526 [Mucor mucedo]|uniref:Uncharacterized protein n=1 Tax=Mucor saturninus TaxID=64648 RepID=A0A8H7UQC4_9FUNG|nr:uncharacterized protein EV154DRAFT_148526 [Mucor mucedo]KAG2194646.1 hypothetical protein INT47_002330 [Mucor saturninus]KAI7866938.1 hypothetical protein EV154DRAFT_148526 [Mucor mucedo]
MKLLYCILCLFIISVYAQDGDSFQILFYQKPNYKVDAGIISGSVAVGGGAGAKSGNMSVGSFKTESFLQVTLYTEKYYQGQTYVYKGSQKKISPAVHVGSVKWKHL